MTNDEREVYYLDVLYTNKGYFVPISHFLDTLLLSPDELAKMVENRLIRKGFVTAVGDKRKLTSAGKNYYLKLRGWSWELKVK